MVDPFATGLAALFRGPRSSAAVYFPSSGPAVPTRVIRTTTPEDIIIGSRSIEAGCTLIKLWKADFDADLLEPHAGDTILIGDQDQFTVMGQPRLDVEGVSWTCEASPA